MKGDLVALSSCLKTAAERHVPHIVIAGNYKESSRCKQGPTEKPFPPVLCSCVRQGEAPIQSVWNSGRALSVEQGAQLAEDRLHENIQYKYCREQRVKKILLQSKQESSEGKLFAL